MSNTYSDSDSTAEYRFVEGDEIGLPIFAPQAVEARRRDEAAHKAFRRTTPGDCRRCSGTGVVESYRLLNGGRCFACDGTGDR